MTIDDKINAEVQYLDKKISESSSKIFDSIEGGNTLKTENEKIQKSESGSEDSGKEESNGSSTESDEGNGEGNNKEKNSDSNKEEKSNDEVSSMSVQYTESNKDKKIDWNEIQKNAQELSDSWDVIESDLVQKQDINQLDFEGVKKSVNNIITDSTNKQKENIIRDSAEFYNGLCTILDKINYDENKINFFKLKQYIYEAYYCVLTDKWDNVKINLENANKIIQYIENVDSQTKIAFSNLLLSTDTNSKEVFYIRCSDVLSRIDLIKL